MTRILSLVLTLGVFTFHPISAAADVIPPLKKIPQKHILSLVERNDLVESAIDHLNALVTHQQVPQHPTFYFDHVIKILDKPIRQDDLYFYIRSSSLEIFKLRIALVNYADFFSEYWVFGSQATFVGIQIIDLDSQDSLTGQTHLFSWHGTLFYLHGLTLKSHKPKQNPFEIRARFLQYLNRLNSLNNLHSIQSSQEFLVQILTELPFSCVCNLLRFGTNVLSHYSQLQALDNGFFAQACSTRLKALREQRYSI